MSEELKLWVVTVDTEWCGTEETYLVIATEKSIGWEADTLAYENYYEKIGESEEELEEEGYTLDDCVYSSYEEYSHERHGKELWDDHNLIVLRKFFGEKTQ